MFLEYPKQLLATETLLLWYSSGNCMGNSWVPKHSSLQLINYKKMDKLNANIEQSNRNCMHFFLNAEHSTWFTKLQYVMLAINTTVNVSSGQMIFMHMH